VYPDSRRAASKRSLAVSSTSVGGISKLRTFSLRAFMAGC